MTIDEPRVVEIHIPSELGFEKVAMVSASAIAQRVGLSKERLEDLKTAVAEACINAIEHGNSLRVDVQVLIILKADSQKVQVSVIDNGHKPIPASVPDRAGRSDFRGMGMSLIYHLMDEVKIKSEPGRNEIQMIIKLKN
ncbi:ATP-binding protein [candidate division KSB1 bacterium]|nr:ATP-binding protein [candidate division KSB1 bacterium]